MSKPILRKTCISKLPIEQLKKHGKYYVVSISRNPKELEMMPGDTFEKLTSSFTDSPDGDLITQSWIRSFFKYAVEYFPEDGATCYIYDMAPLLGNVGDRLDIFWDNDRFRIVNKNG